MEFTAILERDEDMYVAKCSEMGTVSQGATIDEAIDNLREATEVYLEEFPVRQRRKPIITFFEIKNVPTQENIR